jgi:hypothetical protein
VVHGNLANGWFGFRVSSAGDVNGDGYADVLVGATGYDNNETDEGRVSLYYGNGGRGLSVVPQQRAVDDTRAIAHLGPSDSIDSLTIGALGRTPFGRGSVRLEWEVKILGQPMNGSGTVVETQFSDTGTGGVALGGVATGLQPGTPNHWRARLRYAPGSSPFAQRSRWFTIPWGGWNEAMMRTAAPSGAGRVPDGTTGPPLAVAKASGGMITLSWSPSCVSADLDYEVYEGKIGSYYSHAAKFCSTSGDTTMTFVPAVGNSYYIVVPINELNEGSYGLRSDGSERPVAADACGLVQQVGVCP